MYQDYFHGATAAIPEIITKVSDYFQGAGAAISEIITKVSDHFQGAAATIFVQTVSFRDCNQNIIGVAAVIPEIITNI